MEASIKFMIEPLQAVIAECPSVLESAMIVGDVVRMQHLHYTGETLL